MQFASALATGADPDQLAEQLYAQLAETLSRPPDLLALFYTRGVQEAAPGIASRLQAQLRPGCTLGVGSEAIIGLDQEVERGPAISALAGSLPGVKLQPFHLSRGDWERLLNEDERLQQRIGTGEGHCGQLLLADPFTTPIGPLLERLDGLFGTPSFGGMASAAQAAGGNLLILDDRILDEGAIGLGLGGSLRIDTVVSQGCRPIGLPMVVTKSDRNVILELGRRPALQAAEEMLRDISEEDSQLVRRMALMIGVVINEYQPEFRCGDFLIRSLVGADHETGAIAVGDLIRPGQTVQFHVRDAQSARKDLQALLAERTAGVSPAGGLLFTCNGRGSRMFSEPHHDIRCTHSVLPGLPVAGFFAMGELGPVGGRSFIHGHTASLALFSPANTA